MSALPPEAYAAALAAVPGLGRAPLVAALRDHEPMAVWRRLGPGDDRSVGALWDAVRAVGGVVLVVGRPGYPPVLLDDPTPPAVLFARGDTSLLGDRRVAIVGTRNATAAGRSTAATLAHGLAVAGVHVVSGLARGIDGAAHRGVLQSGASGRPIAVVGSGFDVPYPREHAALWAQVAEVGLLLSEAPPGAAPEPWRFPLRNRLIAALADVVVVVESRERGGSLITVDEAIERGRPVMAVPGSLSNRAAVGTNRLLRDGAAAVLDVGDVLTVLAIDHLPLAVGATSLRTRPDPADRAVLDACSSAPVTLEGLAAATGATLPAVAMSLARLVRAGWLHEVDGWFEYVGAPS